jgi:hypothetical protein
LGVRLALTVAIALGSGGSGAARPGRLGMGGNFYVVIEPA